MEQTKLFWTQASKELPVLDWADLWKQTQIYQPYSEWANVQWSHFRQLCCTTQSHSGDRVAPFCVVNLEDTARHCSQSHGVCSCDLQSANIFPQRRDVPMWSCEYPASSKHLNRNTVCFGLSECRAALFFPSLCPDLITMWILLKKATLKPANPPCLTFTYKARAVEEQNEDKRPAEHVTARHSQLSEHRSGFESVDTPLVAAALETQLLKSACDSYEKWRRNSRHFPFFWFEQGLHYKTRKMWEISMTDDKAFTNNLALPARNPIQIKTIRKRMISNQSAAVSWQYILIWRIRLVGFFLAFHMTPGTLGPPCWFNTWGKLRTYSENPSYNQ